MYELWFCLDYTVQPVFRLCRYLTLLLACVSPLAGSDAAGSTAAYGPPQLLATITDKRLPETSGLVAGRCNPDCFWTVNDSGNKAHVFALHKQGNISGSFAVAGITNVDWEDLAAFTLKGEHYLLIPDIGDNAAVRPFCQMTVVREPELGDKTAHHVLPIAWSFAFRYQDGARDCEAVAVDEQAGLIYLISKRDEPPRIYTLPLRPPEQRLQQAQLQGTLPHIPRPTAADLEADPDNGKYRSQITAMDIDGQRQRLVLATYKHLYLFSTRGFDSWAAALQAQPLMIKRPLLRQAETVCFDQAGNIFYGSEQLPWPLMQMTVHSDQQRP